MIMKHVISWAVPGDAPEAVPVLNDLKAAWEAMGYACELEADGDELKLTARIKMKWGED